MDAGHVRSITDETDGATSGPAKKKYKERRPSLEHFIKAYRRYERALDVGEPDARVLELAKAAVECLNHRYAIGAWQTEGDKPCGGLAVNLFWEVRFPHLGLRR